MPSFCNPNDKPTIYYKFKGESTYRRVQIGVAPIEIILEPVEEFKSTTVIVKSGADSSFLIPANSERNRLVFKLMQGRDVFDIYGEWTNRRTRQRGQINPYNYTTKKFQETVFDGTLAKDGYSMYIDVMFSRNYPVTFTFEEYF